MSVAATITAGLFIAKCPTCRHEVSARSLDAVKAAMRDHDRWHDLDAQERRVQ